LPLQDKHVGLLELFEMANPSNSQADYQRIEKEEMRIEKEEMQMQLEEMKSKLEQLTLEQSQILS